MAEAFRGNQKTLAFGAKPKPHTIANVLKALLTIAKMEGNKSQDKKASLTLGHLRYSQCGSPASATTPHQRSPAIPA